jgi:hypothetical protein
MKFAVLLVLNVIAGLAIAAFFFRFSLVVTPSGEYLFVETEQANECRIGGPCAVYSKREFIQAMMMARRM